ncbi:Ribonuclease D domain protein [Candidatus Hepatincolaceae symbiont of Richtersius coronifer]
MTRTQNPNLNNNAKIYLHLNDLPIAILTNLTNTNKCLAIDTETMGLNLARDRLCLIQLKGETNEVHLIQFADIKYDCPNLKTLLNTPDITKIFHYARFDVAAINDYLGILCQNIFCTKIASKLVRTYTDKHGLKDLCKELLTIELKKEQQSSFWGAEKLTEEQQLYAANDVLYLHNLKTELEKRLKIENREGLAKKCFDFIATQVILDKLGWNDEYNIFAHK